MNYREILRTFKNVLTSWSRSSCLTWSFLPFNCFLSRHEMQHFVNNLEGYLSNQILNVTWSEFQEGLLNVCEPKACFRFFRGRTTFFQVEIDLSSSDTYLQIWLPCWGTVHGWTSYICSGTLESFYLPWGSGSEAPSSGVHEYKIQGTRNNMLNSFSFS